MTEHTKVQRNKGEEHSCMDLQRRSPLEETESLNYTEFSLAGIRQSSWVELTLGKKESLLPSAKVIK